MALANSKDKNGQTPQESARAAIKAYPSKSDEQIRVRKKRHLDVDGVLARSFKDVKPNRLDLDQQSFKQGEAS